MKMLNGAVRKGVAMTLMALQLAGCASMGQVSGGLGGLLPTSPDHKGALSDAQQTEARIARSISQGVATGKVGYSQPEYQRRLARFNSARNAVELAGTNYTREQFIELSTSLTELLQYVDLIESGSVRSAQGMKSQRIQSSYQIQPGQTAYLSFNGYCLKAGPDRPYAGEAMQLIAPDAVWSPEYETIYRNLIQQNRLGEPTPTKRYQGEQGDLQIAIWTLQGLNDGLLNPNLSKALSDKQKQMLFQAGLPPQKLAVQQLGTSLVETALPGFGASMQGQGIGGAVNAISSTLGRQAMSQAGGSDLMRSAQGFIDIPRLLTNPQVLGNPAALASNLNSWASAPSEQQARTTPDALDQYSLLAPGVAAQTISTGQLAGKIQVTNLSGKVFTMAPGQYVANARSNTQPVGLSNWALDKMANAVEVVKNSGDSAIRQALFEDLRGFAADKAFQAFANPNSSLLGFAKGLFKSKVTQDLVTSVPVLGNVVSLGMILSGKNLDGSDMNGYDYASAAIGMVPVAGNIAKALGGSARIAAHEISRLGGRLPSGAVDAVDAGLQVYGSNTSEAIAESTPGWLTREFDAIARETIAQLPETSRAVAARGTVL
ncbi:TPA: hypothetical protein ACLG1D_006302 [Pseudomonas aeruginosa]